MDIGNTRGAVAMSVQRPRRAAIERLPDADAAGINFPEMDGETEGEVVPAPPGRHYCRRLEPTNGSRLCSVAQVAPGTGRGVRESARAMWEAIGHRA